nr:seminase [Drosophila suzukii]
MQRLLACCLLATTLSRIDVLAQTLNLSRAIDVKKLAKIVVPPKFETRVVGGRVTTNEKLGGYLIALRYDKEFICGGTLLHELIVLTAAHCFSGREKIKEWVAVGATSKLSDKGIQRKVKEVIKSAQFSEDDMNMDVAVVRLKSPMKGKKIGKLSLCSTYLKPGLELVVSGWGMTDPNGLRPQNLLRTITVPILDKRLCRSSYWPAVNITDSMFCAGVLGKKDACTFDSGGPLVYKKQICGIVSFGIGCASRRYSGVYTDVMYVKPFIEKSIKVLLAKS